MKQIWVSRAGNPEVLELREAPDPEPGPGQVRIVVHAAGVNFADLMARMGVYMDGPPPPCVVGYEVSGVIDRVGEGVAADRIGERVLALTRFGGYTTQLVVDDVAAITLPEHLGHREAASLPVTALTTWMILEEMHRVREGDRVLVHSAGGGVGLMACDLIKRRGAIAVGTASASKHSRLREWGYDELVDYRSTDYEAVLRDGPLFDLVMDPLGGNHWAKGLRLLKPGGKIACYGMSVNVPGEIPRRLRMIGNILRIPWFAMSPPSLINGNKGVLGVNMGRLWDEGTKLQEWLSEIFGLVGSGELRVAVHTEVPFSRAADAHRMIHARENFGKVVLVPGEVE